MHNVPWEDTLDTSQMFQLIHSGDVEGLELCGEVRTRSTLPIIVTGPHNQAWDRVRAFELGADDFVSRPCAPRELLARIRARVRRRRGQVGPLDGHVQVGALCMSKVDMKACDHKRTDQVIGVHGDERVEEWIIVNNQNMVTAEQEGLCACSSHRSVGVCICVLPSTEHRRRLEEPGAPRRRSCHPQIHRNRHRNHQSFHRFHRWSILIQSLPRH